MNRISTSKSSKSILIKCNENGEIPINSLIVKWPELKKAEYYRVFPKFKKQYIAIRFYDQKGRWIRIKD